MDNFFGEEQQFEVSGGRNMNMTSRSKGNDRGNNANSLYKATPYGALTNTGTNEQGG